MNVSNVNPTDAALNAIASGDDKRVKLQMLLLKKTLEVQQEQASAIQRMAEGKGNVLDIRV